MELRRWKTHESKMKLLRRTLFVSLFAAASLVCGYSVAAAAVNDPVAELDAFITTTLKEYQVPGAAVAVVRDGKVSLVKGYGVRDVTKPGAVDENTIFQLASVTKTLTAAAAATVVDEGKLDWDKPIFNYLPEFVGYDPYMTRWLTERDLLAQRTGWPAYTGDQLDSFGYDRAEILRRLRFFKPRYSLREVAQYSNPGFFVAGEVAAARRSSRGMISLNSACSSLWRCRALGRLSKRCKIPMPPPRMRWLTEKVVVEPTELDVTGAASSGTSTAADMSKLMLMFLNKGAYNGKRILKPETVEEIFKRSMVGKSISPICRRLATRQVFTTDSASAAMITRDIRSSKKAARLQVCERLSFWCRTRMPESSFSRTSISLRFLKLCAPISESTVGH